LFARSAAIVASVEELLGAPMAPWAVNPSSSCTTVPVTTPVVAVSVTSTM
jgi:hypothetical protein